MSQGHIRRGKIFQRRGIENICDKRAERAGGSAAPSGDVHAGAYEFEKIKSVRLFRCAECASDQTATRIVGDEGEVSVSSEAQCGGAREIRGLPKK
jgi:hypothetical protein